MTAPLGDESKMNQHLASNVILISCETEELEETYKILMLTGVDLTPKHDYQRWCFQREN